MTGSEHGADNEKCGTPQTCLLAARIQVLQGVVVVGQQRLTELAGADEVALLLLERPRELFAGSAQLVDRLGERDTARRGERRPSVVVVRIVFGRARSVERVHV